jgi:hypothetical protein
MVGVINNRLAGNCTEEGERFQKSRFVGAALVVALWGEGRHKALPLQNGIFGISGLPLYNFTQVEC